METLKNVSFVILFFIFIFNTPVSAATMSASEQKIAELQAQIVKLTTLLAQLREQQQLTVETVVLGQNLALGSRGDDVLKLQKFLIGEGMLASDASTGYFGPLTENAVKRWQIQHGIVSQGNVHTTGLGAVGPQTRTAIATYSKNRKETKTTVAKTVAPKKTRGGNSGNNGGSSNNQNTNGGGSSEVAHTVLKKTYSPVSFCSIQNGSSAIQRPDITIGQTMLVTDHSGDNTIDASDIETTLTAAGRLYKSDGVIQRVNLNSGTYVLNTPLSIPSGVLLSGENAKIKVAPGASLSSLIEIKRDANYAGVYGLTLEASGQARTSIIAIGDNAEHIFIYDNDLTDNTSLSEDTVGSGSGISAITVGAHDKYVHIDGNTVSATPTGITIRTAGPSYIDITNNTFSTWRQRAIYVVGATDPAHDITISHNQINPPAWGLVRQPIAFQALTGSTGVYNLKIKNNRIEGHYLANIATGVGAGRTTTQTKGTADMLSLQTVRAFEIDRNCLYGGGELGIFVGLGSKSGTITNNYIIDIDLVGIEVGLKGYALTQDVLVKDNIVVNTSRNRANENHIASALAGIEIENAKEITVRNNTIKETGGYNSKRLQCGLYLDDVSEFSESNNTFTVPTGVTHMCLNAASLMSTNKTNYALNETITVSFSNMPGNQKDWIGIYQDGANDTTYKSWLYLDGTKLGNTSKTTGTLSIPTTGLPAGTYDIRVYENNGYTKLVETTVTIN